MKTGICLSGKAYLPEAYAYESYLNRQGMPAVVAQENDMPADIDIRIRFMGFDPRAIKHRLPKHEVLVHEYGSLSVPPLARMKDALKSVLNVRPHARIFQNEHLLKILGFRNDIPFMYRDMGVDKAFFGHPDPEPDYDLVYAGYERPGLLKALKKLAGMGNKVLVIGDFSREFRRAFDGYEKVVFSGRLLQKDIPAIYRTCRLGLNYTPDVYPYRFQTSTKTLEYCAAGLGVVSNRYLWAGQFCNDRNARFLWLDEFTTADAINRFDYKTPDVSDLEWNMLLERAGFAAFIKSLYSLKVI